MALPPLPSHYQERAYRFLVDTLPFKWFHQLESKESPLYPYLWGMAATLAYLRYSREQALDASIPMRSDGIWLSLHLESIGLQRRQSESKEKARDRYQWEFRPTRNSRTGELSALENFIGLSPPRLRLETDRQSGRFGEFRLVLDDETLPWNEVDFSFVGPFISRYVSNGIIPSVDVNLQCLLLQQLPYFRFSTQFAMGFNQLGPFWERPAFISPLRLNFARNLIAQVSAAEWRSDADRLIQFHREATGNAPGTVIVYLSDNNPCPYLRVDFPVTDLPSENLSQERFQVDGFKHHNQFPRIGPTLAFSLDAPPLEVDVAEITVGLSLVVDVPKLSDLFDLSGLSSDLITLQFYGVSFTRFKIVKFILDEGALTPSTLDLQAMSEGIWTLALTEGNPSWGNFPPSGTTRVAEPFVELPISGTYWTNAQGDRRASFPSVDENGDVYLAVEFLYPKQAPRTIRELELRLSNVKYTGGIPHYRRLAFPLNENANAGFVFLIRGFNPG